MSTLLDRIASGLAQPNSKPLPNDGLRIVGTNLAVTQQPTVRIGIYPGIISYEDMQPLIAPDGAPISATSEGTWGQLYRVGRS